MYHSLRWRASRRPESCGSWAKFGSPLKCLETPRSPRAPKFRPKNFKNKEVTQIAPKPPQRRGLGGGKPPPYGV